jgi:hypothetical protein
MPDASGYLSRSLTYSRPKKRDDVLESLPRIDPKDYIWHTVPAKESGRKAGFKWEHVRWKPSVHRYLDQLHGAVRLNGNSDYTCHDLPVKKRVELYRKALGIIYEFSSWEDLMPMAIYRRRVENIYGIKAIDEPLFALIEKAVAAKAYGLDGINVLSDRMPPRSQIRRRLRKLAVITD